MAQYVAQWPDHNQNLATYLQSLYEHRQLTDLALQVQDVTFYVHQVVLAACSPYFQKFVMGVPSMERHHHVLQNVSSEAAQLLIEFMYTGRLRITPESLYMVQAAARQLEMTSAVQLCDDYISGARRHDASAPQQTQSETERYPHVKREIAEAASEYGKDLLDKLRSQQGSGGEQRWPFAGGQEKRKRTKEERRARKKARLERKRARQPKDWRDIMREFKAKEALKPFKKRKRLSQGKFKCMRCPRSFKHYSLMRLHQRSHIKTVLKIESYSLQYLVNRSIKQVAARRNLMVLKQHGGLHAGLWMRKMYKCRQCNKNFNLYSKYLQHYQKRHTQIYTCSICDKTRATSERLRAHRHKAHDVTYLSSALIVHCPKCPRVFWHKPIMQRHFDVLHRVTIKPPKASAQMVFNENRPPPQVPILQCRYCTKSYQEPLSFKRHLMEHNLNIQQIDTHLTDAMNQYHTQATLFKCETPGCKSQFFTAKALRRHKIKVCGKNNKGVNRQHECSECNSKYRTIRQLAKHGARKHPEIDLKCPVTGCRYRANIRLLMERHLADVHVGQNEGTCDICWKKLRNKRQLAVHKHTKHGIVDPNVTIFECQVKGCKYKTTLQGALTKHEKSHQDRLMRERNREPTEYPCTHCSKMLTSKYSLEQHIKIVHMNIRPYVCDDCGAAYGTEAGLNGHRTKHTGFKPYKCRHCDYAVSDRNNYKYHLFAQHKERLDKNTELFLCDKCDYATVSRTRINEHMKSHSTIRAIPCTKCDKMFVREVNMRDHFKRCHLPKIYKCQYCSYDAPTKTVLGAHVRIKHTHPEYKPFKCPYCSYVSAVGGNVRSHVKSVHKGLEVRYIKLDTPVPKDFKLDLVPTRDGVASSDLPPRKKGGGGKRRKGTGVTVPEPSVPAPVVPTTREPTTETVYKAPEVAFDARTAPVVSRESIPEPPSAIDSRQEAVQAANTLASLQPQTTPSTEPQQNPAEAIIMFDPYARHHLEQTHHTLQPAAPPPTTNPPHTSATQPRMGMHWADALEHNQGLGAQILEQLTESQQVTFMDGQKRLTVIPPNTATAPGFDPFQTRFLH